jgi:hypothetical protein
VELADLVAWGLFAVIFAFLGMVLGATWKQMEREAHDAGLVKHPHERSTDRRADM